MMSVNTRVITLAVVKYKDKFLIGKRAKTKKFAPDKWEFISGFIDSPETAEQIILRELKEETGLKGRIVKSAEPFTVEDKEGRWVIIPFLIEVSTDKFVINKKDHSELKWVSEQELENYQDLGDYLNSGREFYKALNEWLDCVRKK